MFSDSAAPPVSFGTAYSDDAIIRRIHACPKLPSLGSINSALHALVRSDHSLNSQIAEVIRRDPSLSARLLRMVNSVYFGLSTRVNNIEEAVFYLGLRQIRELAMATPVLEELHRLQQNSSVALPWKEPWMHSLATALLTREILAGTPLQIDDDTDYLVGLLHNIGKIVMAHAFPEELRVLIEMNAQDPADYCAQERALIGWDHTQIGAHYATCHHLSEEIVVAIRHHHAPDAATRHALFPAAVQVADYLVRYAGISGGFEPVRPVEPDSWLTLPGWRLLYGDDCPASRLALAALARYVQRLPTLVHGML